MLSAAIKCLRVCRMMTLLLGARVAIQLAGLAAVVAWIDSRPGARSGGQQATQASRAHLQEDAAAIRLAGRLVPMSSSCLVRSVALLWSARRRGLPAELVLGVPFRRGADFEAHAWIEADGEVVNDSPDVRLRYAVLGRVKD